MSTGDLLYSDTEEALRASVGQLFAERCPPESVVAAYDSPPADFAKLWRTLAAELGVAGLLVPESLGGAGASAREAAVVMEEVGRAVAPVPFLSSAVLATVALLHSGETETLSELAQGELTAAWWCRWPRRRVTPLPGRVVAALGCPGESAAWRVPGRPTCWWCRSPGPTEWNCIRCAPMRPASR